MAVLVTGEKVSSLPIVTSVDYLYGIKNNVSKRIAPSSISVGAGATGATGATGPAGPTGSTGPAGADGADGSVGEVTSTGSTTPRNVADRFAEIINVKDYGAVGNGVADDTAKIQAAIDHSASSYRGVIFFPPGTYKITAALTFTPNTDASIVFRGVGQASILSGNFSGYILDVNNLGTGNPDVYCVEFLQIKNIHATGGCVRFRGLQNASVYQCFLQAGLICVCATENNFTTTCINTDCLCPLGDGSPGSRPSGSVGFLGQNNFQLFACNVLGYDHGMRVSGAGIAVVGCRLESNNVGVMAGRDINNSGLTLQAAVISGTSFENNLYSMYVAIAANTEIAGCSFTGVGDLTYGLYVDSCSGLVVLGCSAAGVFTGAGFGINTGVDASVTRTTFVGCSASNGGGSGLKWVLPGSQTAWAQLKFINCDNPTIAIGGGYLPASPVEGMEFDLSDGSTATWGATCAGGGSNHVKVRYNGTNWTVVGK